MVAAQFTFGGHIYLAIAASAGSNSFNDAGNLLDITGVTGYAAFDTARRSRSRKAQMSSSGSGRQ